MFDIRPICNRHKHTSVVIDGWAAKAPIAFLLFLLRIFFGHWTLRQPLRSLRQNRMVKSSRATCWGPRTSFVLSESCNQWDTHVTWVYMPASMCKWRLSWCYHDVMPHCLIYWCLGESIVLTLGTDHRFAARLTLITLPNRYLGVSANLLFPTKLDICTLNPVLKCFWGHLTCLAPSLLLAAIFEFDLICYFSMYHMCFVIFTLDISIVKRFDWIFVFLCAGDLHMAGSTSRDSGLKETVTLKWCTPRTNSIGEKCKPWTILNDLGVYHVDCETYFNCMIVLCSILPCKGVTNLYILL